MNQTTLKIAMAAFMHDMGKFAGMEELGISSKDIDEYDRQLYQPSYKGRYSHVHAVCTAEFIKRQQEFLPMELNNASWGEGDIFTNLAASHHKPETVMQWIIAIADRVSSGWDRDTFENDYNTGTHWKDYKKTRLLPIFEQLRINELLSSDSIADYNFRYPLAEVSPANIFPRQLNETISASKDSAAREYKDLYNKFSSALKNLAHRDENIALWFEHFDSLMMVYTSHIPAARTGNVVPDVSLYDHCRTTAALAAAIYRYHDQAGTLTEEAVKSYADNKFLLINGDFRGIQNFIFSRFSESKKFRSKILRGRSFSVSLMAELAADMICRETGLPFTSVVLNAAGKFTIIAPNTPEVKKSVDDARKQINDWLIKFSYGETAINIAIHPASCNDFVSGNFSELWDRFVRAMDQKKYFGIDMGLYGGVVEGYLDSFVNQPGLPAICPLCGKRPAMKNPGAFPGEESSACALCRDHIFIGTGIVKKKSLSVLRQDANILKKEAGLFEPVFGRYQITFDEIPGTDPIVNGLLLKQWNLGTGNEDIFHTRTTLKFISGYVPRYTPEDLKDDRLLSSQKSEKKILESIDQVIPGDPKTLNHIAFAAKTKVKEKYQGIEALGVLKADVDYLGLLMACGLEAKRFTLSRLATLSRQMNYYFAVFLPDFLSSEPLFQNIYTVFAGGDDLFLIGPWNRIIDLSRELSQSFADYVCHNPDIHFSAGIVLHKPGTPVDAMAKTAESALESAKSTGRNRLTLFSETVTWPMMAELEIIEQTFEKWLDSGWLSRVMFYRLNEFIKMAAREKQIVSEKQVYLKDMMCTKWRAMLVYAAERNIAGSIKGDERKAIVQEVTLKLTDWLNTYGSNLTIPIWKILYNRR